MTLKFRNKLLAVEEEGRPEITKVSKQNVFHFAFQKQGSKQLYHTKRKDAQSCLMTQKDDKR